MKNVSTALAAHLHKAREIQSCDLYELTLLNGSRYYYTDTDIDVEVNGHIYRCPKNHGSPILKRTQTKTYGEVTVDTLTVTIYADKNDCIGDTPFFKACHDGILDRASLSMSRCFFGLKNEVIGVVGVFSGITEVKSCGGLMMKLTVKSKVQGLSQEFPRRRFYPQGTYASSGGQVTSSAMEDSASVIAPFVPLKEVLL